MKISAVAALALAMAAAGCGSHHGAEAETSHPPAPPRYDSVMAVHVAAAESDDAVALTEELLVRGREERVAATLIDRTAQPAEHADVELEVKVTDVKRVSKARRLAFGSWSGRAIITASVVLSDTRDHSKLVEATVQGKSSTGQLPLACWLLVFAGADPGDASGGTTEEAVTKTAEEIIALLQGNHPS